MNVKRVLIAGVGNVLRGDDGFGVRALEAVRRGPLGRSPSVRFWESGIAGIGLVQELMDRFDALVVLDAMDRGGTPGELYVLEPDVAALRAGRGRSSAADVDLHEAKPEKVLHLAASLDVLPDKVWIVGAQAIECDELGTDLTPAVAKAVDQARRRVERLVGAFLDEDVTLVDELLQILFWLRGESLLPDASAKDLERWLSRPPSEIEPILRRMVSLDLVEPVSDDRFRLTERGIAAGGRRFSDEFSDMTKPGHGECGDPDCECQDSGDPADCRHNVV